MTATSHPDEDVLLRYATGGLIDGAAVRDHVAACGDCRRYVETTHELETALRNERIWSQSSETSSLHRRLADFQERLEREDEEARAMLGEALRSEYTFH